MPNSIHFKQNKFHQIVFLTAALGLMLTISGSVLADTSNPTPAATKSSFSGNQLMGASQPPVTERPATVLGPVEGVTAKTGSSLLVLQPGSVVYLVGDSTLHKYEMGAKSLQGSAVVKASAKSLSADGGLLKALQAGKAGSMALVVPVNFLKSKESGLDDNAYKALNAKDFPEIKFELSKETLAPGAQDGTYVMTADGNLTISGVTNPITLTADAQIKDNQVRLKGVQKLKMTDYKITPPKFNLVVTSIVCTDEIEIHYDVTFAPAAK